MSFTVAELAARLGGEVEGDPTVVLDGVAGLEQAGPHQLSFLANRRYARQLATTAAGAVLIDATTSSRGRTVIRLGEPYVAFARALELFHPRSWPDPGVDPRAAIAPDAEVHPTATVEPFVVVSPGARVGPRTWLQGGAYLGRGVQVGADCRLMPNSVVMDGCVIGDEVWLNPGAVVGSEGFGFAPSPTGLVKIPQVGSVTVGSRVELGANTCVDRGAMGTTRVGEGAKLDNLCQVAHAAEVGPHCVMVAYSGVAGTVRMGTGVTLAARSSVLGHLRVGDGAVVAAHTMVHKDVEAGQRVSGVPAIAHGTWLRSASRFRTLPELEKRVAELEERLADALEGA